MNLLIKIRSLSSAIFNRIVMEIRVSFNIILWIHIEIRRKNDRRTRTCKGS
jgi:hypothetical protein